MRIVGLLASGVVGFAAINLTAAAVPVDQIKPDFSGTWTWVSAESATPGAPAPTNPSLWTTGGPVTLKQTPATLTIDYTSNGRAHLPVTLVYNLDGTPRANVDRNSVPALQQRTSRASWRGSSLEVVTLVLRAGAPANASAAFEFTEVLTLDSSTTMSVHMTRKGPTLTDTAIARYRRR